MVRQYVAVLVRGNPAHILERICQVVQAENLTRTIPVVKHEKKPDREFYVFLAVESTQGTNFIDPVKTVFTQWDLKGKILTSLLSIDDIKSIAAQAEFETYNLNPLPYKSLWSKDTTDPFDLSDALSNTENMDDPSLGKRYDQLVYWLSANAQGTWQTFVRVCDILKLADGVKDARSIFRRLILLGYIENSDNGQRWSICPTVLVKCAADPGVCFLTGQQTPKLIEHLKEHWEVETFSQLRHQGPSCVKVHGVFSGNVPSNGFHIEYTEVVSIRLAQLLPDLEGWRDILPVIDRLSTTSYNIELWDGKQFTRCDKFYERHGQYFGESGMYRLTKKEKNNPYRIVLYFHQPNQRWLRGDWYGLRFLAYNSAGRQFEVQYDSSANEILIPSEEHWPLLYERVLVLASGMLPARDKNFRWLKYTNISNELVQLLAEKLSITITEI